LSMSFDGFISALGSNLSPADSYVSFLGTSRRLYNVFTSKAEVLR
jgi:hypothetical protein